MKIFTIDQWNCFVAEQTESIDKTKLLPGDVLVRREFLDTGIRLDCQLKLYLVISVVHGGPTMFYTHFIKIIALGYDSTWLNETFEAIGHATIMRRS